MVRRFQLAIGRIHGDRRGATQSIEVLIILAVCVMVCLGVTQVTGVTSGGGSNKGLFSGIGSFLDKLDLGSFLPW